MAKLQCGLEILYTIIVYDLYMCLMIFDNNDLILNKIPGSGPIAPSTIPIIRTGAPKLS